MRLWKSSYVDCLSTKLIRHKSFVRFVSKIVLQLHSSEISIIIRNSNFNQICLSLAAPVIYFRNIKIFFYKTENKKKGMNDVSICQEVFFSNYLNIILDACHKSTKY